MLLQILLLIIGLVLIIKGGDLFVAASLRIAELLDVPRVIIGSTLVSLATTSPELVVSMISGFRKESGLSVGNAVGSCVCNIGLILGILAIIQPINIRGRLLRVPLGVLIFFGLLLIALCSNLLLGRMEGIALVIGGLGYYIYDFLKQKKQASRILEKEAKVIEKELTEGHPVPRNLKGSILKFILGAVIVIGGSSLLVESAVKIAEALKVPTLIVGLTAVAIGTSLPEMVTMLSSIRQNASDLAVGNILGANLANLTFVVGTAASLSPVQIDSVTLLVNFPGMLLPLIFLLFSVIADRKISRREGIILVSYYLVYLLLVVVLAPQSAV